MNAYEHFQVCQQEGATVIELSDAHLLDRVCLNELRGELEDFITTTQPNPLVISFRNVTRFGTEAVNVMLFTHKQVAHYGGEMHLSDMDRDIREIFSVLRLERTVFNIVDTSTALGSSSC
ncbi:MAG: STAS domain-containing protein [Planctomycetes bacterium]|nr:STAS domain-containing protein [Planctomycetota bacterium]